MGGRTKNTWTNSRGITLVALVVTIVVLLILAGVSLSLVIGENGIIIRAQEASDKTKIADFISAVQLDLLAVQIGESGEVTVSDIETAVSNNGGTCNYDEDGNITDVTFNDETIELSEIYSGTIAEDKVLADGATSYVGYYADIDGDGTIDGVIYADLAIGGSGTWNSDSWSSYSYSAQTGLKDYYISQTDYEGIFGTKDVLSPTGSGGDRFYVMALEDVDSSYHYWYYSAYGNLDSSYNVSTTANDFGEGKANTIRMMTAWNAETYGSKNGGTTYNPDLWGLIQDSSACSYSIITSTDDSGKWFVPSKAEWAAFGDYLYTKVGVTTSNYGNYDLSSWYWSSSQCDTFSAYGARFNGGYISYGHVNLNYYVRLSATF